MYTKEQQTAFEIASHRLERKLDKWERMLIVRLLNGPMNAKDLPVACRSKLPHMERTGVLRWTPKEGWSIK